MILFHPKTACSKLVYYLKKIAHFLFESKHVKYRLKYHLKNYTKLKLNNKKTK